MRALIAFLIAPFPAALFQSIIVAVQPKGELGITRHPSSMFVAMALYFYGLGLLVGVPILVATRKRQNHTLAAYAGATGLIMLSPVVLAIGLWTLKGHPDLYTASYLMMLFGLGGGVAGSLYWWIVRGPARRGVPKDVFD